MRTFLSTTLLLVACAAFAKSSSGQTDARTEINQAQAEYRQALLSADTAALARIWTTDYTFTNGRGMYLTRDDRLNNIKTGATELSSIKGTAHAVRVYGDDTAIITGKITLKAKYSGQPSTGDYRYLNVWIKRGGKWQMAANQITPIIE